MKIVYIANERLPTERAYGINITQMCQAMAESGIEVCLIVPKRKNKIKIDLFEYYQIKKSFCVTYVPIIDVVKRGFFGYWLSQIIFSFTLLFKKISKANDIIYTRDQWSAWLLSLFGYRVFYEMQGFPVKWRWAWKNSMKSMLGIICANQWKIEQCNKLFNIPLKNLILARNGFNHNIFLPILTKEEARKKIKLSIDKTIVLYSGHLYDWKGVGVLTQAAKLIPNILIVLVGGTNEEIAAFTKKEKPNNNVVLLGQKPYKDIPCYLMAADVLVLPNSALSNNSRFSGYSVFDTSPIKMFEYMASRRPIVASDLPSITEVLNKTNAVLVKPDDPQLLASGIKYTIENSILANCLAEKAYKEVQEFTWEKRAKIISNFIKSRISNNLQI